MTDIVERLRRTVQILSDADSGENVEINYFDIAEAAAEIERLRAASEWRDISTAPSDGTTIDVLNCHEERVTDVSWRDGAWRHWWIGGFDSMEYVRLDDKPTHWMPLPAPPQRNEVTK